MYAGNVSVCPYVICDGFRISVSALLFPYESAGIVVCESDVGAVFSIAVRFSVFYF